MITKTNFTDLLKTLGFIEEDNIFQKSIGEADLKVDFSKQSIIYPEDRGLTVNRQDTCNFSHPENFVVFECVHRLLDKGYKPEHLELEPTMTVTPPKNRFRNILESLNFFPTPLSPFSIPITKSCSTEILQFCQKSCKCGKGYDSKRMNKISF